MSTSTPWGPSQSSDRITRGITFYSTAGHGGFKVSPTFLARMPEAWRFKGGWFEEDCEATLVILAFPQYFTAKQHESALEGAKNYFPDELRAAGYEVREEESSTLQQRSFLSRHANDYVVISAWGDWHKDVPQEQVGVLACKPGTGEEGYFLVPKEEYSAPRRGRSFVIDLARHPRCAPLR